MQGRSVVHPSAWLIMLLVVLLIGLAGCTTTTTPEESTPVLTDNQPSTAAPVADPTQSPTSRSPTTYIATPAGMLQPEATATPTAAPPTPSPTIAPIPTSSEVEGWLLYENEFLGYSFSYPPEARIRTQGVTGFPTDELPENKTVEEYRAELEEKYPNDLCVSVGYKRGFVTIQSTDETLSGYASPCGITGVGDYTIEHWEEVVTIDGQPYTAGGNRLTGGAGRWQGEFYLLDVNGLRIDFGDLGGTEEEFAEVRETLLQIVASLRFFAPQTGEG